MDSISREGRGWSGSSSNLCLLFEFLALGGPEELRAVLPSLDLLRIFVFEGLKRNAEVGGTDSSRRLAAAALACTIRIIAVFGKRFPITSSWVTSNSWSS